ncbi:carboxylating nicotinate-nucleotide diphosphorylase [bacterium]|nr:carboxylating nicotinate-nucleotide diphosphorylase [bacterium]
MLRPETYEDIVKLALKEDIANGDITTNSTIPDDKQMEGKFVAKQEGIICGLDVMERIFQIIDQTIQMKFMVVDGAQVEKGDIIATISGPAAGILIGERTALNFLQRLCGIATKTHKFARLLHDIDTFIIDTRKTTPGHRMLEKYAVLTGGGKNHRFNLSDGVLIKDNHIASAGSIATAVEAARKKAPHTLKIEVEVESLDQVSQALEAGADIIMLDNMSIEMMEKAVKLIDKKALTEASGNMDQKDIRKVAETGVDFISIGGLTHTITALDISLRLSQ